jgi:hypothetical protein
MMINYYDLIATGGIHSRFNAAMINILYEVMNKANDTVVICLHSEHDHNNIVRDMLASVNIKILSHSHQLSSYKTIDKFIKSPIKDLLSIFYVIKAYIFHKKGDMLFFALVYPFALKVICLLSKAMKIEAYVCLHGELHVFANEARCLDKKINKMYLSLMKSELTSFNKHVRYIVLGEPIFDDVKHIFANTQKPIIINHPYIFPEKNNMELNFKPLVIGQIGSGNIGHGTPYLFQIAKMLEKEISEGKVKFILIGKIHESCMRFANGLVEYYTDIIDQKKFESLISTLHFSLQLRDGQSARATAYGTLGDSLIYDKPFFALHNNYIDFYVNKLNQSFYVYNSIDGIVSSIKKFLLLSDSKKMKEYMESVERILELKRFFSIEHNMRLFSMQLNDDMENECGS